MGVFLFTLIHGSLDGSTRRRKEEEKKSFGKRGSPVIHGKTRLSFGIAIFRLYSPSAAHAASRLDRGGPSRISLLRKYLFFFFFCSRRLQRIPPKPSGECRQVITTASLWLRSPKGSINMRCVMGRDFFIPDTATTAGPLCPLNP